MSLAADRGIDYGRPRLSDRDWKLYLAWMVRIDKVNRNREHRIARAGHLLRLVESVIARGGKVDSLFENWHQTYENLLRAMLDLPDAENKTQSKGVTNDLVEKYKREIGDLNDPKFKAQVDAAIAWIEEGNKISQKPKVPRKKA